MDPIPGLSGKGVLIVGASAGIGRSIASQAIASGARVVVAARRQDALDAVVSAAGSGLGVATDITDSGQCDRLAEACGNVLGTIDLVVNATGVSVLRPIADMTPDEWTKVFATNVFGASNLIAAVIDLLGPTAIVATLSSEAAQQSPRTGLGAYGASKAALEKVLAAWRNEHGPVRFSCIAVGSTYGTEVANEFDPALMTTFINDWMSTGTLSTGGMTADDLANAILGVLSAGLPLPGVNLEHVTLRTPAPVIGSWAATRDS